MTTCLSDEWLRFCCVQGWLDADGYLTLTGRIKELINRGGEKISPLEVRGVEGAGRIVLKCT